MKNLIENKDLVVISDDKDFCVVILKISDYDKKLQSMTDERITNGTYTPTIDLTLSALMEFQDFLSRNFRDISTHYKDIIPVPNQSGRLYTTAKTHNFHLLDETTVENLKIQSGHTHIRCRRGYSQLFGTIMPKCI